MSDKTNPDRTSNEARLARALLHHDVRARLEEDLAPSAPLGFLLEARADELRSPEGIELRFSDGSTARARVQQVIHHPSPVVEPAQVLVIDELRARPGRRPRGLLIQSRKILEPFAASDRRGPMNAFAAVPERPWLELPLALLDAEDPVLLRCILAPEDREEWHEVFCGNLVVDGPLPGALPDERVPARLFWGPARATPTSGPRSISRSAPGPGGKEIACELVPDRRPWYRVAIPRDLAADPALLAAESWKLGPARTSAKNELPHPFPEGAEVFLAERTTFQAVVIDDALYLETPRSHELLSFAGHEVAPRQSFASGTVFRLRERT